MKSIIWLCSLILVLSFASCASFSLKSETAQVASRIAAYTVGYEGVQKDKDVYLEMAKIAKDGLVLIETDEATLNQIIDDMKSVGAEAITSNPLIQYQVKELLSLIDVELDIGIPADIPEDKHKIVKESLVAFIEGVHAGKNQ